MNKLIKHVVSLVVALVLVFFTLKIPVIDNYVFGDLKKTLTQKKNPGKKYRYLHDYQIGNFVITDFCKTLHSKNSFAILGSSELTGKDTAHTRPFNFIPSNTNYNAMGIGSAGNQSLSILTQLAAFHQYIEHANVLIMVSPSWFIGSYASGTSVDKFLTVNNKTILYNIFKYDNGLNKKYKNYIQDYICKNYDEIAVADYLIKSIRYDCIKNRNLMSRLVILPLSLSNDLFNFLYEKIAGRYLKNKFIINKIKVNDSTGNQPFQYTNGFNWDAILQDAKRKQKLRVTNNDWGINDRYYNEYLNGKKKELEFIELDYNQEFTDFKMLLDLLNDYRVNAVFVIQPLNPYYYAQMERIESVIYAVESEIEKRNFPVYNMFTSDTNHYEKEILDDVMHLSDYGWLKVNQFVLNYFFDEQTKTE